MSTFYFYQISCSIGEEYFATYGVLEETQDYIVLNASDYNGFEVFESIKKFKQEFGKDFVKLTRLE